MEQHVTELKKEKSRTWQLRLCDELLMVLNVYVCVGLITRPGKSCRVWCVEWECSRCPVMRGYGPGIRPKRHKREKVHVFVRINAMFIQRNCRRRVDYRLLWLLLSSAVLFCGLKGRKRMYIWILLLLRKKVPRQVPLDVHCVGYRPPIPRSPKGVSSLERMTFYSAYLRLLVRLLTNFSLAHGKSTLALVFGGCYDVIIVRFMCTQWYYKRKKREVDGGRCATSWGRELVHPSLRRQSYERSDLLQREFSTKCTLVFPLISSIFFFP